MRISPITYFKIVALGLTAQQLGSCALRSSLNPQARIDIAQNCEIWANSGDRVLVTNHVTPDDASRTNLKVIHAKDYKEVSKICAEYISQAESSRYYSLRLDFYELVNGKIYEPLKTGAAFYKLDEAGKPVISDQRLGNRWKMNDALKAIHNQEAMLDDLNAANRKGETSAEAKAVKDIASKGASYTAKAAIGAW